jgi:hypothetical protein
VMTVLHCCCCHARKHLHQLAEWLLQWYQTPVNKD